MASMTEMYALAQAMGEQRQNPVADTLTKAVTGFQGGIDSAKKENEKHMDRILKELEFMQKARAFQTIQQEQKADRGMALDGIASTDEDQREAGKVESMINFGNSKSGKRLQVLWKRAGTNLPALGEGVMKIAPGGTSVQLGTDPKQANRDKLTELQLKKLERENKNIGVEAKNRRNLKVYQKASDEAFKEIQQMKKYGTTPTDMAGKEITFAEYKKEDTDRRYEEGLRALDNGADPKGETAAQKRRRDQAEEDQYFADNPNIVDDEESRKHYKKLKAAKKI